MVSIEESNQEQVMMPLLVFKSSCLPVLLKNKKGQMFAWDAHQKTSQNLNSCFIKIAHYATYVQWLCFQTEEKSLLGRK